MPANHSDCRQWNVGIGCRLPATDTRGGVAEWLERRSLTGELSLIYP